MKINLEYLSTFDRMLISQIMFNAEMALIIIRKWFELGHTDIDKERDKKVIDAIKFVDKAAEVLLSIGVKQQDISKMLGKRAELPKI